MPLTVITADLTAQPVTYFNPSRPLITPNADTTTLSGGLVAYDIFNNFKDIVITKNGAYVLASLTAADYPMAEQYTIEDPAFLYSNMLECSSYFVAHNTDTNEAELTTLSGSDTSLFLTFEDSEVVIFHSDRQLALRFDSISSYAFEFTDYITEDNYYGTFSYYTSGNLITLQTSIPSLSSQYYVGINGTDLVLLSTESEYSRFVLGYAVSAVDYINDNTAGLAKYYKCGGDIENENASIRCDRIAYADRQVLLSVNFYDVSSTAPTGGFDLLTLQTNKDLDHLNPTNEANIRQYNTLVFNGHDDYISFGVECETKTIQVAGDTLSRIELLPDTITCNVNDGRLAISNAIFGESPQFADRLYSNAILNADSVSAFSADGPRYLCSWLYAPSDCNTTPLWLDRWYHPSALVEASAYMYPLSASTEVVDVSSAMLIQPGVYTYFHQGSAENMANVDAIQNLHVHINDWATPADQAGGNSVYTSAVQSNNDVLILNGNNWVQVEPSSGTLQDHEFSLSFWAYADDWSDAKGDLIAGNYYQGGYGIFYNTGIPKSLLITVIDNNFGHMLHVNGAFKKSNEKNISSIVPSLSSQLMVVTDNDQNKWIFDDSTKIINVVDVDNLTIAAFSAASSVSFDSADVNSGNTVFMLSIADSTIYQMDALSGITVFDTATATANLLYVDKLDQVNTLRGTPETRPQVNSQNELYALIGGNLYKDGTLLTHVNGTARGMAIDSTDNIWIAYSTGYTKINSEGDVLVNKKYPNGITSEFVEVALTESNSGLRVWLVCNDTDTVIEVDSDGAVVRCHGMDLLTNKEIYDYDPLTLFNISVRGDLTGYNASRKYSLPIDSNGRAITDKAITARFKVADFCSNAPYTISLHADTSKMQAGWHHFCVTYKSSPNAVKFYVDGVLSEEYSSDATALINYRYKSPFLIGSNTGRLRAQATDSSSDNNFSFVGMFDDLRIYGSVLSANQVRALFWTKKTFNPLQWPIDVAKRNAVEIIDKVFKHKTPYSKSTRFNVIIKNSEIADDSTREAIEIAIRDGIEQYIPAVSVLNQIKWH